MTMPKTFWEGIRKKLLSFAKQKVCSMNHLLTLTEPWSRLAFYPLKQCEVGWWVMQVLMLLSHPTHTAQGAACSKSVWKVRAISEKSLGWCLFLILLLLHTFLFWSVIPPCEGSAWNDRAVPLPRAGLECTSLFQETGLDLSSLSLS